LRLLIGVVRFFFLRLVVPDRATGGRADKPVVTGDMPGDATDGRALEATLCIGGGTRKTAVSILGDGIRSSGLSKTARDEASAFPRAPWRGSWQASFQA